MATQSEATEPQRVCFICLETSADTPNGSWVKPCPCSLEAHEPCMLRWVAESESSTGTTKPGPLRCPACRAPIHVEEPFNPVVGLYNAWHRTYDRAAPHIIGAIFGSGAVVGSAWYGWKAVSVFAGTRAGQQWFAINTVKELQRVGPAWYAVASSMLRMSELAAIGPSLVIISLLPSTLSSLLPVSVVYAGTLISRGRGLRWPPSPQWALTLIPTAFIVHRTLYREFIKPIERRLNRALMGRPPAEDVQPGQAEAAGEIDVDPSIIVLMLYLTRFIYTFLGLNGAEDGQDNENNQQGRNEAPPAAGIEVEVRFGARPANDRRAELAVNNQENPVEAPQNDLRVVQGPHIQVAPEDDLPIPAAPAAPVVPAAPVAPVAPADPAGPAGPINPAILADPALLAALAAAVQQQPAPAAAQAQIPAADAPVARQNRRPRPRRPRNQAQAAPRPPPQRVAEAEEAYQSIWNWVLTRTSTAVLLPGIAYGMGELIRHIVPFSWTRHPGLGLPATGLLQMRWGRSLAGMYLFFVARNVFTLTYKYHKVLAKKSRRVRNHKKEDQAPGQGQEQARRNVPGV